MKLGVFIAIRRKQKKVKQSEIAKYLGWNRGKYIRFEAGTQVVMSSEDILLILNKLQLNICDVCL